jgi:CDGSH-type Zn-finger protein
VSTVTITVRPNGPYKLAGPVRIVAADGREIAAPEGKAVALCRCGHSRTKPFCDASHRRVGFVADDAPADAG